MVKNFNYSPLIFLQNKLEHLSPQVIWSYSNICELDKERANSILTKLPMTHTLAYFGLESVIILKSLMTLTPSFNGIKLFFSFLLTFWHNKIER
jgi:hypothetical protein